MNLDRSWGLEHVILMFFLDLYEQNLYEFDEAQMMLTLQITNKMKGTRKVNTFDLCNIFELEATEWIAKIS